MLSSIFDVEEAMLDAAFSEEFPLAIFLDFEAAFPSIDQSFIKAVLTSRNWPVWLQNFLNILCHDNFCHLSVGGSTGLGFSITAGVRQGCPLSPLIFAIGSDVLIRRVRRLVPEVLLRAYADDIALVLRQGPGECGRLG